MKHLFFAVLAIAVVGSGIGLYASRQKSPVAPPAQTANQSNASDAAKVEQPVSAASTQLQPRPVEPSGQNPPAEPAETKPVPAAVEAAPEPLSPAAREIKQFVDTLVSPQASYAQRQAVWKQLRESGRLDPAIKELEQRAAGDPNAAEYPATLGQAYLQKAGTVQDVREQGILGMKSDQVFDTALQLDPKNWEARFTKAIALSHWPEQLNKGQEVIDQFTQLIEQQETQTPQPKFAQTYVQLGDQYRKLGNNEYARATWQCGARLFPTDATLQQRLAQQAGK